MSTRSWVARVLADNTIQAVYVHCDGYLNGVGRSLIERYTTEEKRTELFRDGPWSGLEGVWDGKLNPAARLQDGLSCRSSTLYPTMADLKAGYSESDAEYLYLLRDDAWHVYRSGKFVKLTASMCKG